MSEVPWSVSRRTALSLPVAVGLGLATGVAAPARASTADLAPTPDGAATLLSQRIGYTQWTNPLASRASGSGNLYFTGVTETGDQRVYRLTDGAVNYVSVGQTVVDDHNAPALSVAEDRSLAFTASHPGRFRVHATTRLKSITTGEPSPFGEPQSPFGTADSDKGTYAQVLRDGDRVVALSRLRSPAGWHSVTSGDAGRTWNEPRYFYDPIHGSERRQAYIWFRERGTSKIYDVVAYFHPSNGEENWIGHLELSFDEIYSGQVGPLKLEDFETVVRADEVYDDQPQPDGTERRIRLFDVTHRGDRVVVAYGTWSDDDPGVVYRMATRSPAAAEWNYHRIEAAGPSFGGGNGNYVAGVSFDTRPGVAALYYGYRAGDTARPWRLAWAPFSTDGPGNGTDLFSDTVTLARPMAYGDDLVFLRLRRYEHYTDYRFSLYLTSPPNQ